MKEFWEARYAERGYAYGTEPNVYFKEKLSPIKPAGKLLLPAEGEGRNAVYAARLGWQVTAFDFSSAGRRKALALAERKGVPIDYLIAGVEEVNFPDAHFDALALIYAHFAGSSRAAYHQKLLKMIRKGGTIILEPMRRTSCAIRKSMAREARKKKPCYFHGKKSKRNSKVFSLRNCWRWKRTPGKENTTRAFRRLSGSQVPNYKLLSSLQT